MKPLVPCLLLLLLLGYRGGFLRLLSSVGSRVRKPFPCAEGTSIKAQRDPSTTSFPYFPAKETSPELISHHLVESRYNQEKSDSGLDFIAEEKKPALESRTAATPWTELAHSAFTVPQGLLRRNGGTAIQNLQQSNASEDQHRSGLELVKGATEDSVRERWSVLTANKPSLMPVTPSLASLVTQSLPEHLGNYQGMELHTERAIKDSKVSQANLYQTNSPRSYHRMSQAADNSTKDFPDSYWNSISVISELSTQHRETQPSVNSFASHPLQETLHRATVFADRAGPPRDETIAIAGHKQQRKTLFSTSNPAPQATTVIIMSTEGDGLSKPVESLNTMSPASVSKALLSEKETLYILNISVHSTTVGKLPSPENVSSGFSKERENKPNTDIGDVTISFPDPHSTGGVSVSYQQVMPDSLLHPLLKHTTIGVSAARVLEASTLPSSAETPIVFQQDTNFSLSVERNTSDSALTSEYTKLFSTELNPSFSEELTKPSKLLSELATELTRSRSAGEGPTLAGYPGSEGTMSTSHSPPISPSHSTSLSDPVTNRIKLQESKQNITSQRSTMLVILQIGTKHRASKISEQSSTVDTVTINPIGMSQSLQNLETLPSTANNNVTLSAENLTTEDFTSSPVTVAYFVDFKGPNFIPITERESPTKSPQFTSAERLHANQRAFIMEDQPPGLKGKEMYVTYRLVLEKDFIPGFENSDSPAYRRLALSFQETVTPFYKVVPGFERLDLLQIRKGSVILEYNAAFRVHLVRAQLRDWQVILDRTGLPSRIKSGLTIANSTVISLSVADGQVDLCRELLQCPPGFVCTYGRNGSASCTSLCHRGFCKNDGICTHHREQEPMCQCPVGNDYWFMGASCDYRMTQQKLIGISCAVALSVLSSLALVTYLLMRHFKALLTEAKLSPTKSSYRRFSRFDDISSRYWSWSESWLTASGNSLDNPAYSNSEELLYLHRLESNCCRCQETAPTQGNTLVPVAETQSFPCDWARRSSGITAQTLDSGKVSEMSLCSRPVQSMPWTPFPAGMQTTKQQSLRGGRSSSCKGMERMEMERSWTV
ncbi:interphotoreceptor matrix proteoglycan 2-like isoform X2 [Rhinatrema bivittatum]|uniref:interphotoreceptor matrix proteoglycan 2-like isoform X2 n=1 Tax=Rhinatrema bivittatum TaxID=194408 RepID=UPI00112A152C|nr:interphotoreceptor matrix proteoglycan 2-like isoform X2 [Rhinatrema bivittatum]